MPHAVSSERVLNVELSAPGVSPGTVKRFAVPHRPSTPIRKGFQGRKTRFKDAYWVSGVPSARARPQLASSMTE